MKKINGNELAKILYTLLSDNEINKISVSKFRLLTINLINILGESYVENILEKPAINLFDVCTQDFITDISESFEISFSLTDDLKAAIKEKYGEIFLKFEEAVLFYNYCEKSINDDKILVDFKNETPDGVYRVYYQNTGRVSLGTQIFTDGNVIPTYYDSQYSNVVSDEETVEVEDATYVIVSTHCDGHVKKIEIKATSFDVSHLIEEITKIKNGLNYGYTQIGNSKLKKYMLIRQ